MRFISIIWSAVIIGYITMKPSEFKLNSDYLSIAQTGRREYTATFAGKTLNPYGQGGDYTIETTDFTIASEPGAIDRIMISTDKSNYYIGEQMSLHPANYLYGALFVNRINKTTIRVQFVMDNYDSSAHSYPTQTFYIKITTFKSPNIF